MNRVLTIAGEPKPAVHEEVGLGLETLGSYVVVKLVRADGSDIPDGDLIWFMLDANGRVIAERCFGVNAEYVVRDPVFRIRID
jgi:hypothetical protein